MLLISEVERYGLRPLLTTYGIAKSAVNYRTKQSRAQWHAAIARAPWRLDIVANYVPYPLRRYRALFGGTLGRFSVCDRYKMLYRQEGTAERPGTHRMSQNKRNR